MKTFLKHLVAKYLGRQVKKLRSKNDIVVVAVAGSIGKTSTKYAIAIILEGAYRVGYQDGNYNDKTTVPLVFFGLPQPSLFNPFAWLTTFYKIRLKLRKPYPYDVVLVEIGTDGPGQIAEFASFLDADLSVLTAITPEHMEFFPTLDDVANEELGISDYSKELIVNADLVDTKYQRLSTSPFETFGQKVGSDYRIQNLSFGSKGAKFELVKAGHSYLVTNKNTTSKGEVYSISSAMIVAHKLGISWKDILSRIPQIKPAPGRMQKLNGINNSTIIDESYNSSPEAAKMALDALYSINAPQKIALLGNMNELGDYSRAAHEEIGDYCDSSQLDLVVTLGNHANSYLAPRAKTKGCKVQMFENPYDAGEFIRGCIQPKAVILVKGSQNGVFSEEAIKSMLANSQDEKLLVRQSDAWIAKKRYQFGVKT